ncbi:MAG: hypothetical protein J5689_03605 [Clostridia bacterium]|nr:hypothetical protein [Clostridia bacterium]
MNEAELFKLAQELDEEVSLTDYCQPENEDFDNGEFTKDIENKTEKPQNKEKSAKKAEEKHKKDAQKSVDKFKDQYFSYYDDIKIDSHKVTDW